MNVRKPSIGPANLTAIIDAAPSRIQKRLDRDGDAASDWIWTDNGKTLHVDAGGETVTLPVDGTIDASTLACSCLLSPRCFHVLAVASSLPIASNDLPTKEPPSVAATTEVEKNNEAGLDDTIEVTDEMRSAAAASLQTLDELFVAGVRAAGVVQRASILRDAHRCRAANLHRLYAWLLAVDRGVDDLRRGSDSASVTRLRSDILSAIASAHAVIGTDRLSSKIVGTARRKFHQTNVRRLQSLTAEPILTDSGYAGAVVRLIGDDQQMYQVGEVRPGGFSLVADAYHGGVDLGGLSLSAMRLSRSVLDVQNMNASSEGRLGRGKATRWVVRNQASLDWPTCMTKPLAEQINRCFENSDESLVGISAEIIGAIGSAVVVRSLEPNDHDVMLRLVAPSLDERILYQENLRWLARSPRLRLRIVARPLLDSPGHLHPLTIITNGDNPAPDVPDDFPRMSLPDTWQSTCHLGLDALSREHFTSTTRHTESLFPDDPFPSKTLDPVDALIDRRLTTLLMGGRGVILPPSNKSHCREIAMCRARSQPTAGILLERLATTAAERTETLCRPVAALETYRQAVTNESSQQRWQKVFSSDG